MGSIISVINNKGGTSKTITSISLAHALAKEGKKVLVIDNDPQANATAILLKGNEDAIKYTLHTLYEDETNVNPNDCVYWSNFQNNLYCIANNIITTTVEPKLIKSGEKGFFILRAKLRDFVLKNFDLCIIDNPPNIGTFVINSLCASDFALIPTDAGSRASIDGLVRAVKMIDDIKSSANPDLKFLRILMTKVDRRTAVSQVILTQLRQSFGAERMFNTVIPVNTEIQKAELVKKTIFKLKPFSKGANAYRALVKELLAII